MVYYCNIIHLPIDFILGVGSVGFDLGSARSRVSQGCAVVSLGVDMKYDMVCMLTYDVATMEELEFGVRSCPVSGGMSCFFFLLLFGGFVRNWVCSGYVFESGLMIIEVQSYLPMLRSVFWVQFGVVKEVVRQNMMLHDWCTTSVRSNGQMRILCSWVCWMMGTSGIEDCTLVCSQGGMI